MPYLTTANECPGMHANHLNFTFAIDGDGETTVQVADFATWRRLCPTRRFSAPPALLNPVRIQTTGRG